MASDPKADAALALHRFGVSPRPGSIAAIASDPRGALLADLDRAGAGRIPDADLLPSGPACARGICLPGGATRGPARRTRHAAGQCARRRRLVTGHETGGSTVRAGSAQTQSRSWRAAADLSRRSQGALQCRARRRDRFRRTAGLVLVEPFLRFGGQGQCAPDLRRLRARSDPRACARALRRHAAGGRIPSGDADLSRQCALDRSRTRPPACGRSAASTKISPAKSSSCIRSACAASTPRRTSPGSPM